MLDNDGSKMKLGTPTGLFDRNNTEIRMGDTLKLYDSDGHTHTIKVGYFEGMFVEDGTATPISDIISAYDPYAGGNGVEIK